METITFCVPFYGTGPLHILTLLTCVTALRQTYPDNRILVCKTSDSYFEELPPDLRVEVWNTFQDGSHILGAMELLVRACQTQRFCIVHDSMFLLRPLPIDSLDRRFYFLWYFDQYRGDVDIRSHLRTTTLSDQEIDAVTELYQTGFPSRWVGCFGPAFGGTLDTLKGLWSILNLTPETVRPYLGRQGLELFERIIGLLACYLRLVTPGSPSLSIDGNIFRHPNAFSWEPVFRSIPAARQIIDGHFYKVWMRR